MSNLSVRFGNVEAVQDLTVEFPENGLVALIGPNGAGKSTLLDVLSGFVRPAAGKLLMSGSHQCGASKINQFAARLHQVLVLPESVTVNQYLRIASRPVAASWFLSGQSPEIATHGEDDDGVLTLVREALEAVGLSLESKELLKNLSWGQKRVVALSAIVLAPKQLILLDEPFAGLAPGAADAVSTLLEKLASRKPIIVAEHDLDQILPLADQVLVMARGRLQRLFEDEAVPRDQILPYFLESEEG